MQAAHLIALLRFARPFLLAVAALCVLGSLLSASTSSLLGDSPFLPPGWGEKPERPAPVIASAPTIISRQLEFRGVFELNGVTRFSVFDKKEDKGYWLAVDEAMGDFEVVRYDDQKRTILIRSGGRTEELALATPNERSMPIGMRPTSLNHTGTPRASITRSSSAASSSTRRTPVVPRRRLKRPSDKETTGSTTTSSRSASTPSNPLPPVPPS